MSTHALAEALYAPLPPEQKLALIAIADNASPTGEVTVNFRKLTDRLFQHATEARARYLVDDLVERGHLTRAPELDDLFDRESTGFIVNLQQKEGGE